jgi:hypothetical protein
MKWLSAAVQISNEIAIGTDEPPKLTKAPAHRYVLWRGALELRDLSVCIACGRPPELHGPNALDNIDIIDDPDTVEDRTHDDDADNAQPDVVLFEEIPPLVELRGEGGSIGAGRAPVEGDDPPAKPCGFFVGPPTGQTCNRCGTAWLEHQA